MYPHYSGNFQNQDNTKAVQNVIFFHQNEEADANKQKIFDDSRYIERVSKIAHRVSKIAQRVSKIAVIKRGNKQ